MVSLPFGDILTDLWSRLPTNLRKLHDSSQRGYGSELCSSEAFWMPHRAVAACATCCHDWLSSFSTLSNLPIWSPPAALLA